MAQTAFERCGGFSTVRKVVSAFYDKILESETLQQYFANVDMRRLIDHQTKFIATVMGGPASYSDEVLRRVHAPLKISQSEFAEMAFLLRETLEDFDLDEADIDHVDSEIRKRGEAIVSRDN